MSFKEKNIVVTLISFSLIFVFFNVRIFQLLQNDSFTQAKVFQVWGVVIACSILVTVIAMILTHGTIAAFQAIRTKDANFKYEDSEDERDKLIDLKGTNITYTLSSLGGFVAMLSFVLGQQPLVMFSLLIFFGVLAQIIGDIARLMLYRKGF